MLTLHIIYCCQCLAQLLWVQPNSSIMRCFACNTVKVPAHNKVTAWRRFLFPQVPERRWMRKLNPSIFRRYCFKNCSVSFLSLLFMYMHFWPPTLPQWYWTNSIAIARDPRSTLGVPLSKSGNVGCTRPQRHVITFWNTGSRSALYFEHFPKKKKVGTIGGGCPAVGVKSKWWSNGTNYTISIEWWMKFSRQKIPN